MGSVTLPLMTLWPVSLSDGCAAVYLVFWRCILWVY